MIGELVSGKISWHFMIGAAVLVLFAVISVEDYYGGIIRNSRNGLLLLAGIADCLLGSLPAFDERLAGFFCVSIPLLLISLLSGGGIGGGDIKLSAAAGFFLGGKAVFAAFFLSMFLAGSYGGFLLIRGGADRKTGFALGPFLCLAFSILLIAGDYGL